ncbi:MAG: hypothetical protein JWQ09_5558 [Segetibacter sp.]|nr:hypothetical protein [Segetibacter sp.]
MTLTHEFIDHIPEQIENGKLYISIKFCTAIHNCCCGCGNEVVTPISPEDWRLAFDGKSVSLSPSIGNWSFKCQSHYWIVNNEVEWCRKWKDNNVESNKRENWFRKYFKKRGRLNRNKGGY